MIRFFCMSEREEDIICSVAIVAGIARKLGTNQTIILKKVPDFAPQYPTVSFITDVPAILSSYRRAVHEDVVYDGDKLLVNTWTHQLRDAFFDGSDILKTLLNVTENCFGTIGLRKKVNLSQLLDGSADREAIDIISERSKIVCITRQAYNHAGESFIGQIMSLLSRYDFVINASSGRDTLNSRFVENIGDFAGYVKSSDVVIAANTIELLPLFRVVGEKEIVILSSDNLRTFKNKKCVKQPIDVNDLVSNIRS